MTDLRIGEPDTVVLTGTEYRVEWVSPDDVPEPMQYLRVELDEYGEERWDEARRRLWGGLRPTDEGDYGGHLHPLYNMAQDLGPGRPEYEDMYGVCQFDLAKSLQGEVEWFMLLALAGDDLAGKIRFFPKTLTVPRWIGWSEDEHRREWTDDILWIGAAYADPIGLDDGLHSELVRRVVEYGRAAGFRKVQAVGCEDVWTYAMWAEAFPASTYRELGFRRIAWGDGSPDAFEHMVNGCHGPRSRELARAALESGLNPDTAHLGQVLELDLHGAAGEEPGVPEAFMTPLHEAAAQDHLPTAEYLLELGANPNARDREGRTPLDRAETEDMRELLRGYGTSGDRSDRPR